MPSSAEYQANREYYLNSRRAYYATHKEQERTKNRDYARQFRPKLFELLGKKCVKCGFSDIRALVFDHVKSGGLKEIHVFRTNIAMYRFYVDHPLLAKRRLQVLCANCNLIKRYETGENYVLDTKKA